jgi:glucokinase
MIWSAGIDLGGTQLKAVAVTPQGEVLDRASVPTEDRATSVEGWSAAMRGFIERFTQARGTAATTVGLCAPGIAAPDGRSVACCPVKLQGLESFDWTAALGRRSPVPMLNDAHAALVGEAWLGAARGKKNAVMYTLGTGVGGAILIDGKPWRGAIGRAGHLGHATVDLDGPPTITGMPGGIEVMIGECTLGDRTGGRCANTEALVAAHRAGDAEATKIWRRSVYALACAIASAINVIDPEIVVIGGGIAKAGDALFTPLAEELARVEWRPRGHRVPVVPAALGEWAGALGAARNAFQSDDAR